MKIAVCLAALVLFVVSSAGCMTMAGFEQQERAKAGGAPDVKLMPTLESSEKYNAYRQEVDGWGLAANTWYTCNDWLLDLTDIVSIEMSFGPGILADVQPTKIGEIGLGYADVTKVGWRKRAAGYYHEKRREGGIYRIYYRHMDLTPVYGTPDLFRRPRTLRDFSIRHNVTDRHWADVGAQAHALAIGASAYVSPKEAIDFAVSTVCLPFNLAIRPISRTLNFNPPEIDLGEDDTRAQVRRKVGLDLYNEPEEFLPAEVLDQGMRVGY
jgi:hypothetical protein